jgi:hypothetical protein
MGSWSFGTVLLVAAVWVLLDMAMVAAFIFFVLRGQTRHAGSGGVGGVSLGINLLSVAAFLLGPPIVLVGIWYALRR